MILSSLSQNYPFANGFQVTSPAVTFLNCLYIYTYRYNGYLKVYMFQKLYFILLNPVSTLSENDPTIPSDILDLILILCKHSMSVFHICSYVSIHYYHSDPHPYHLSPGTQS